MAEARLRRDPAAHRTPRFIPAIVLFAGPVVAAIAVGRTPAAIAVGVASVTVLAVVVARLRGLG